MTLWSMRTTGTSTPSWAAYIILVKSYYYIECGVSMNLLTRL